MPTHLNDVMWVLLFWAVPRTLYRAVVYGTTRTKLARDIVILTIYVLATWSGAFG
jgi:hypothetical protein